MEMFIKKDDVQWKYVNYLRKGESNDYDYGFWLNEPLASWDVFDYWERDRIRSMEDSLSHSDILVDVGTESGWCNLAYGKIVGFGNMVLVEPNRDFWPNIKSCWYKNTSNSPLGCFNGFFSDKSNTGVVLPKHTFPACADGDLIDRNAYKYIHEHANEVPQITFDRYCELTGIKPTAITIDVEGAEFLVLKGAEKSLQKNDMKVWVSEHDELMFKHYKSTPSMIAKFMVDLGYTREVLATDHERHVYYYKA